MARRKAAVKAEVAEDSDLSPPPNGLLEDGAVVNEKNEKVTSGAATSTTEKSRKRNAKFVDEEVEDGSKASSKRGKRRKVSPEEGEEAVEPEVSGEAVKGRKKAKGKRKTKEEQKADAMPLAARTVGHKLLIGAHVSGAGGRCYDHTLYSLSTEL
jgi:AP endonuclease-1